MNWQKQAASRSRQKQAEATNRQCHEDQEYSSPPAHCKYNDQGIVYFCICVFVSVVILEIIQDQALVASKHLLIETEDKTPPLARRGHGRDFADDGADYPESDSSGIDYKVNYRHIGEGIDYMAKKKIMG